MEKQFAYGKTIQLWKNNSPVEKLFDYGRTIRQCENNLIFGKQFDYKNKFDYLKKSEIDFCIHGDFNQRLTMSSPFFEVKYVKICLFKFEKKCFAFASKVVSLKDRQ